MADRTTVRFQAMNTRIEAVLLHETGTDGGKYAQLVKSWFEDMERKFSRFREDSELSLLNRSAGSWLLVSGLLYALLEEAERYRRLTGGLFDMNVLRAMHAAGYDRSFEHAGSFAAKELPAAGTDTDEPLLELAAGMKAVKLRSGAQLDLGGIAKGWSVKLLSGWLRKQGIQTGLINAGGDAAVWDDRPDGGEAELAIQNPWEPASSDAAIYLRQGGAATSSTLGRRWSGPAGAFHHIIDPRSGRSSESGVVQCTVSGPEVTACEVWAKAVSIAGLDEGRKLLTGQAPEYKAFIYTEDRRLHVHEPRTLGKDKEG
ncbi:FAD:protein FMN transferase [Paenibacillus sp. N4]|uniref:FAD:protein FMN transferase n=1 Tax=Paenibacillus vietnamensis TaxID=2590547 RepID=UPI001CD0F825|nr:FAD:protein FMN transferase [Paenibacillus vietnamensis]MCA0756161.1 FAD:protein FMN transferase [Paenibacillus vietnamensis]